MNPLTISFAILGGFGVFTTIYALAAPRPHFRRAQTLGPLTAGVQVHLERAQLGVDAPTFLLQGALRGAAYGLLGAWVTANVLVFIPFFIGGFLFYGSQLEEQRNRRSNAYHHDLATAMEIIVNAWQITPTLSGALQAVATYGPGAGATRADAPAPESVAADFDEVRASLSTRTPLRVALQRIADRRRSPIFDGLATALQVAEEQGTQATEMLTEQALISRQQVETFNEALSRQRSARGEILAGTVGPWVILALVRLLNAGAGGQAFSADFFTTPAGAAVSLAAALFSVGAYVQAMRYANEDLILSRVPTEYGKQERQDSHA